MNGIGDPAALRQVTVTYLEMTSRPVLPDVPSPRNLTVALVRVDRCTVAFYRFLYETVGGPWFWRDRNHLSDQELAGIIRNETLEIYVLYVGGVPAGYSEVDFASRTDVNLAYFGIMPEFVGLGLGPYLLRWTIEEVWRRPDTRRLTVNTCTLDHPAALPLYERFSFIPYDRQETWVDTRTG